ncbi:MAG: membrane integrity-associated transporter subunit PqiC [Methylococcales bacterium]|jgi:uncharacterized protein|nr:membrane integrity-associated transporter subunit PqiC [Methylococcales bacterium]MBT7409712.1 membrane integrity-associated transporter subunit PqiC [Methylococcales bacterium]
MDSRCWIFLLIILLSGCIGGTSPRTHFYSLSADETRPLISLKDSISVGLGPIHLPDLLERPQIVSKISENKLEIGDFDRWGEQLKKNLLSVMKQNLMNFLNTQKVFIVPLQRFRQVDFKVVIEVLELNGQLGQQVTLDAHWTILDNSEKKELYSNRFKKTQEITKSGYEAYVAGHSHLISLLSEQIADQLLEIKKKK